MVFGGPPPPPDYQTNRVYKNTFLLHLYVNLVSVSRVLLRENPTASLNNICPNLALYLFQRDFYEFTYGRYYIPTKAARYESFMLNEVVNQLLPKTDQAPSKMQEQYDYDLNIVMLKSIVVAPMKESIKLRPDAILINPNNQRWLAEVVQQIRHRTKLLG